MSQVSRVPTLSDLPDEIGSRFDASADIDHLSSHLHALESEHPGLFKAIVRMIDVLESEAGIRRTTVDHDEDDGPRPVTIWAESTFSPEEREAHLHRIHDMAVRTLGEYKPLVLVAVV
jgi:hypothetical protein